VNNNYLEPWNVVFNNLTVRQLMNRLSEHNGPRGGVGFEWLPRSTVLRFF
jgi:hypothetical protein